MPSSTKTPTNITIESLLIRIETLEKQMLLLNNTKSKKNLPVDSNLHSVPSKTKRTSGYILYSNAHRDEVKEELSDGETKVKNTDVMKKLAAKWKLLDDNDKEIWNLKAKEIKET